MRRLLLRAFLLVLALTAAASALTWYALEARDVAIIETAAADGTLRRTHVWFVRDGEAVLLEAGTPDNGWYVDIRATKHLRIVEPEDIARECVPMVLANPDGHLDIRDRMRAHYGWRDGWVALLFDVSQSLAVRCAAARDANTMPAASNGGA